MKKFIYVALIAVSGAAVALVANTMIEKKAGIITAQSPSNYLMHPASYTGMVPENSSADFIQASEISLPAVVHVKTERAPRRNNLFYYDPFMMRGGKPVQPKPEPGYGSGVVISGDGYIVTNNHVINGADKVEITLFDKRTFEAKVIGKDPSTDIALLKIEVKDLPYLLYGNSDEVKIGEWVLAVGNPFNLTSTVTAGIVSAKGRNMHLSAPIASRDAYALESFIQTDAAVNPGNSGGALVNTKGQLIGINTAIASPNGSFTGYSFAVPVNLARKVVNDLIEFGKVQRAFLGISIRNVDSDLIEEKHLNNGKGVYVSGIAESGAASKAGLREGDVITKVGEVSVENVPALQEQVALYRPGDKVVVSITRDGKPAEIPVVLRGRDGTFAMNKVERKEVLSLLGGTFEPVSDQEMAKLAIPGGVKISRLEAGKLRGAGIKPGFIITSIDKNKVSTVEEVKDALEEKEGGVLIEGIYPNGLKAYYAFGL